MGEKTDLSAVAVVDASSKGLAIWHANVGVLEGVPSSRLTGAWLLLREQVAEIRNVLAAKPWLATSSAEKVIADLGIGPTRGVISAQATVAAVQDERRRLIAAFQDEQDQRDKARQLVDLVLPAVPAVPERWEPAEGADASVATALAMARWVERLVRTWDEIEAQRLARPFLRQAGGSQQRPLALVVA